MGVLVYGSSLLGHTLTLVESGKMTSSYSVISLQHWEVWTWLCYQGNTIHKAEAGSSMTQREARQASIHTM